ncbi:MAG TPA: beta-ketoacyl synthase N-terminal-like domain-containing protein, partial [Polyangiaceae bacterium]|nr:beta-ketoacyl synthase N-terminal-like domain-containing protein [Polyangiaceae bacterium]
MRDVFIVGVHTVKFGKHPDKDIKALARETLHGALTDAGMEKSQLESVFFSNSAWGFNQYQHCIRGQVALRPLGVEGIPITNVENACAGGSTAFHCAWKDVASGACDVALAIGAEKIFNANKYAVFAGFLAGTDVALAPQEIQRILGNLEDAPTPSAGSVRQVSAKKRTRRSLKARISDLR